MADSLVTQLPKSRSAAPTPVVKYAPTVILTESEVTISATESTTVNINTTSDGAISVENSDSSVASVSKSDKVLTIQGLSEGDATAKIIVAPTTNFFGGCAPLLIHVKKGLRFGIKIKKTESDPASRVSYLYDAVGMTPAYMDFSGGKFNYGDWGDVWFVKDNKPLMLRSSGQVGYYLNPYNYAYREDMTASDVSNTAYDGNAMAQFPLGYIYRYEDNDYLYEILSNVQYDENYKAYAHTRMDGTIAPYFYWSLFGGSTVNSKLRSLKGQSRTASQTASTEVSLATANGTYWYTHTWSMHQYIRMLTTLISKTTNSQAAFGIGNCRSGSSGSVLTTGTLSDKGQFFGYNNNTNQVKVFHVEAFWGDQWNRIAGLINNSGPIYVKMTREGVGYKITDVTGYTNTGITVSSTSSGYISSCKCSEYGMIPNVISGSDSTYYCDGGWYNNSQLCYLFVGASAGHASACGGAFAFCVDCAPSYTGWRSGCGLSCEMPAED